MKQYQKRNTLYLQNNYTLIEGSKITSHHLFLDVMQSGQNEKIITNSYFSLRV